MQGHSDRPSQEAWKQACGNLKMRGGEAVGPCPVCGDGEDRFGVSADGLVNCRVCGDDPDFFRRALEAVGLAPDRRRDPPRPRRPAPRRKPNLEAVPAPKPVVRKWKYSNVAKQEVEVVRTDFHEDGERKKSIVQDPPGVKGPWLPYGPMRHKPPGEDADPPREELRLLIVEGEACVEAALELRLADTVVTTWKGGAKSASKTDWSGIAAGWKEIVIWGDNDAEGRVAAGWIGRHLQGFGARNVKQVDGAALGLYEKGDIADLDLAGNEGRRRVWEILNEAPAFRDPTAAALRMFAEIDQRPVDWLIPDWLARGEIALLAGEAGAGKSTLALAVAAMVSTGGKWFDGRRLAQGDVLIYASEDRAEHTIAPALSAAGADMGRVWEIAGMPDIDRPGHLAPFEPARHMEHLARTIEEFQGQISLVILDPVKDLALKTRDEYRETDIRATLKPLQDLAEQAGVAILGINHFGKAHNTRGSSTLDRMLGSQAWGAVARLVWVLGKDKTKRLALMRSKSNLGPKDGGFHFIIEGVALPGGIKTKRVRCTGALDGETEEIMRSPIAAQTEEMDAPKRDAAAEFVEAMLRDGPRTWGEIETGGKADGHSKKTLEYARNQLRDEDRIASKRVGSHKVVWSVKEPE